MAGKWVKVDGGNNRCQSCGNFVKVVWCFFATLTTYTHCICEECAENA